MSDKKDAQIIFNNVDLPENCEFKHKIPFTLLNGTIIGEASLEKEANKIIARGYIDSRISEELKLEENKSSFSVVWSGKVLERDGKKNKKI